VIGNGVVIDPKALIEEIETLKPFGLENRLFISNRCHLIMPYHTAVESADENRLADKKIGTTSRGIGPCYEDKVARKGIRIGDFYFPEVFRDKVFQNVAFKNQILEKVYGERPLDPEKIVTNYMEASERILPFVTDTAEYLRKAVNGGKNILFEGAQGTHLDIDHGTYPFVTSSNSTAGGACTGSGIGPNQINGIVGITKAYTTRVGGGPFPTELDDEMGEIVRSKGAEFGASTGRPRRCGWFDSPVVRYSCLINSVDTLVVTKLDVLDQVEEINVCTGYRIDGKPLEFFPTSIEMLERIEPEYETHPGWMTDTSGSRNFEDLPDKAKSYINRLSQLVETEISVVSVGPDREETLIIEQSGNFKRLFD
jgi:adenylosuccinate synthase